MNSFAAAGSAALFRALLTGRLISVIPITNPTNDIPFAGSVDDRDR